MRALIYRGYAHHKKIKNSYQKIVKQNDSRRSNLRHSRDNSDEPTVLMQKLNKTDQGSINLILSRGNAVLNRETRKQNMVFKRNKDEMDHTLDRSNLNKTLRSHKQLHKM
jgi:hypothetical protein